MLYRPRHVPGAAAASSQLPPLELRIRRLLARFDASSQWHHVVPGAEEPRRAVVDVPQAPGTAIIVHNAEILLSVNMNSAKVPMGTVPMLEAAGKKASIKHTGGVVDKWIYEGLSRDKGQVLQSSTWTLEGPSGDSKSLIIVFMASDQARERKHLQILLEKDPNPSPLPTAGLPSYSSTVSQHPSTSRRSTSYNPAGASTLRDVLDRNERARHVRSREHDEPASVQPWAHSDDGTVKWTPRWTEEEHQELRAVRRGVDSLRPRAPLYSLPLLDGEAEESSQEPVVLPHETIEELARHIGAFLRYFDADLKFRGQGLEEQAIYIGGFSRKHLSVDGAPVESASGREVFEVLVHLKGIWRRWTQSNDNALLFTLPGGELDGRGLHVHKIKPHSSNRGPDTWTFNSRSGRQLDQTQRIVATAWTLTPGEALHEVGVLDLVYVTFALDEPFKVRERHRGATVEVFEQGRRSAATAQTTSARKGLEGRNF